MNDLITAVLQHYPMILTEDFFRYVIGAGGTYILVNLIFARHFATRQVRTTARPGWAQMRREILVSLRTVLVFSIFGLCIVTGAILGVLPIYTDLASRGMAWFFLTIVMIIIAHDAWFYWTHRLMHHPRLFRHFHRMHHRSHSPTTFAAYSFDMTEAMVQAAFLPLFLLLVPMHPLAIFTFTGHMMLRNAMGHSGAELFPARRDGRPLFGCLTTVTHHDLHHQTAQWNMGLYFTWWDKICGTEHPDYLPRFRAAIGKAAPLMGVFLAAAFTFGTPSVGQAQITAGNWASRDLQFVVRLGPCPDDAELTCGQTVFQLNGSRVLVFRGKVRPLGEGRIVLTTCAKQGCSQLTLYSTRWLETVAARFVIAP